MATTKVTANVLADNSVTQAKLADDAVGADELAANAVVNASIASGAAIDMDKLDGDSLANAITDFAQDDLVILSDTSDSGNLAKITTSNFEDAIFGNISGDVTLAAGGAATLAAAQTNITSVLNTSLVLGRDADNQIKFGTDNQIIFEVDGGDNVIFKTSGEIEASSLDISGDVDIDGTLEADAITINGTTLAETISDTVGAMVGSNTETGIAVTYDDSDNTLDFVIGAGAIVNSMLADDAVGADELAADAVVNASIASGAAIDMDKLDGDSLGTAITDFAQDDLVILSDTSDSGNLVKMTTSNFEDAIFGNISGDATVAAGGALTIANNAVETAMINADAVDGTKIADDSINSEHYVDGSIDTAHIADDQITYAKLGSEFTTSAALSGDSVDWATAQVFTKTLSGDTTLTFSNVSTGMQINLVISGNHSLTLPTSVKELTNADSYDGSGENLISIVSTNGATEQFATINKVA